MGLVDARCNHRRVSRNFDHCGLMSAHHRKRLEKMSAPVIAWLIAFDYVADECGILEVTPLGHAHLHEARIVATRETMGHKAVAIR